MSNRKIYSEEDRDYFFEKIFNSDNLRITHKELEEEGFEITYQTLHAMTTSKWFRLRLQTKIESYKQSDLLQVKNELRSEMKDLIKHEIGRLEITVR